MKRWEELLNKTSLLFSRPLHADEIQIWEKFIGHIPDREIEYAFDNWQRNGRNFPRPHDILSLVEAFKLSSRIMSSVGGCSELCQSRHGKGYDMHDVLWMWKYMQAKIASKEGWNMERDYEEMLSTLDSMREGGPPEWRR